MVQMIFTIVLIIYQPRIRRETGVLSISIKNRKNPPHVQYNSTNDMKRLLAHRFLAASCSRYETMAADRVCEGNLAARTVR